MESADAIVPLTPTGDNLILAWPPGPNALTSLEREFSSTLCIDFYTTADLAVLNVASRLKLAHSAFLYNTSITLEWSELICPSL